MLWQVSEFPSFLKLNNAASYKYTTFCLPILLCGRLGCTHLLTVVGDAAVRPWQCWCVKVLARLPTKKHFPPKERFWRTGASEKGRASLDWWTAESGAGGGVKRSHWRVCSSQRKGKEMNSIILPDVASWEYPGRPSQWAQFGPWVEELGGTAARSQNFAPVFLHHPENVFLWANGFAAFFN